MFDNIEKLNNVDNNTSPDAMKSMLSTIGFDPAGGINFSSLNEQLNNISQDEIDQATSFFTDNLLGSNDTDVSDVCKTLIGGIVDDLKENKVSSLFDMFDTAKSVSNKIASKIDENKMKKTAEQVNNLLNSNNEDKLKALKDEKGNPIGENLLNVFKSMMKNVKKN